MVWRESLHKLEINFQRKTSANGNREMCLKSAKTKCFDFCKVLGFFFRGHEYFKESKMGVENAHQCQKCLHFSHSSSNDLSFGRAS